MKLIFRFGHEPCNQNEKENIIKTIQAFHKESLVIFDSMCEVIILNNENKTSANKRT